MLSESTERTIRVLYVEDDQNIRETISQMLAILGYEVMGADDGQQGIEAVDSWKPDIILMDLRMPVMDGPTAIRILRSNPDTAGIPVFVLSAYKNAKTRDICNQIGVDRFLSKPIDIQKVDAAIREILKHQIQKKVNRSGDLPHGLFQAVA